MRQCGCISDDTMVFFGFFHLVVSVSCLPTFVIGRQETTLKFNNFWDASPKLASIHFLAIFVSLRSVHQVPKYEAFV